jgi:hypothetical protein
MKIRALLNKMTIPRRLAYSFATLVAIIILLGVGGLALAGWLQVWVPGFNDSSVRVNAAIEISEGISSLTIGSSLEASSSSSFNETMIAEIKQQFSTNAATVISAIDRALATDDPNAANVEMLNKMKTQVEDYAGKASSSLGVATTAADSEYTDNLATQLAEEASEYGTTQRTANEALSEQLSKASGIALTAMAIIVALGLIAGAVLGIGVTRSITAGLKMTIESVTGTANQLLSVSSQVAAGAAQTAASTNETTVTVEEVKQTAILANDKATHVAESSENVARVADIGRGTVDATISGIERMQAEMDVVSETINRLSDQTQAVGDIITTVNDLAEQSNLLSVNASIEAAKAGEHGKGFTVVAQEVKNLAEQSKQAVAQIRNILSEIQKASHTAVQAAEQGRNAVEAGRQQSLESGEAIQRLADSASEAAQSAIQISASSRQQLAGMEQISQAIESINEAGNQSVAGTRQVEEEVRLLQELAVDLSRQYTRAVN